jgi:hypothetical protein
MGQPENFFFVVDLFIHVREDYTISDNLKFAELSRTVRLRDKGGDCSQSSVTTSFF